MTELNTTANNSLNRNTFHFVPFFKVNMLVDKYKNLSNTIKFLNFTVNKTPLFDHFMVEKQLPVVCSIESSLKNTRKVQSMSLPTIRHKEWLKIK